jgi:hypothetical protein|tara:strand:+ start:1454 stop:1600 length:147 start_codon:yes stop_codon:yes gene_type:complete
MKKLKTIKVSEEIHKDVKIYCAINGLKVIDFVESLIKNEIKNDTNKES